MPKNILVGQSGGPSSAINASLAGILKAASARLPQVTVYGALNGITGVLEGKLKQLALTANELALLRQTPAMALGSCRYKFSDYSEDETDYLRVLDTFRQYDIGAFFYIGGNDSMDTASKLASYFRSQKEDIQVIGVPKTIDNDLVCMDHTPGFGSAAKYLAVTMTEIIRDTSIYPVPSVTIVEIMGRNSGWLTLAAALPRLTGFGKPDLVYLPEIPFDENDFLDRLLTLIKTQNNTVIAVSEGVRDSNGDYIGESTKSGTRDQFGHVYLSGVGKYLEHLVRRQIGCKVRSIELNIMQRCSAHLASGCDLDESEAVGAFAIDAMLRGETGKMVTLERLSDTPYQSRPALCELSTCANKERKVPLEWTDLDKSADAIRSYLLPLIQGDVRFMTDNVGMPQYYSLPIEPLSQSQRSLFRNT